MPLTYNFALQQWVGVDGLSHLASTLILMQTLVWILVALILYTYIGYPLLVLLVARIRPRPVRAAPCHPRLVLVIPAYNEEAVIERKLRNTLELHYPTDRLEVVVASDGSTDATDERVRRFASDRVRLAASTQRRGKNGLLNHVIPTLGSDVIIVSDANIELAPDALERLMEPFADPVVGGAWGNKIYRNPSATAAGEGEALYLKYEKFMKSCESRIGSIVAGECSCLAFRREAFRTLPLDVPDDFALSTNVVAAGLRLVFVPEARTYEDTSPTDRDEFRRKVRIIERGVRGFFRAIALANPLRTGFYAVSLITRQFLRRAVSVLFAILLVLLPFLAVQHPAYRVALVPVAIVLLLAAAGAVAQGRSRRLPILYVPYFFVLVNVAALAGIVRCMTGRRSVTWQPTARTLADSGSVASAVGRDRASGRDPASRL